MKKTTEANALNWIAYCRVSTRKQSIGLDAQRARIERAAQETGAVILTWIEEKESGKEKESELSHRKGLNRALMLARKHNAVLVVAKHDRLSRDLAFAAHLVFKSGVQFNVLNMTPEAMADPLLFGIYFGLADKETKMISERTIAALAVRKAQGVKLGNPNGAEAMQTEEVKARAREARKRKADENPNNIAASNEIKRFVAPGKKSLQQIADHLNEQGFYTSTGREQTRKSVQLLMQRYNIAI